VAGNVLVGVWAGEAEALGEREERVLEGRPRRARGVLDERPQPFGRPAGGAGEKRGEVIEPQVVVEARFVYCAGEGGVVEDAGEVEQRAGRRGDLDRTAAMALASGDGGRWPRG
jgi:hypothetical protein